MASTRPVSPPAVERGPKVCSTRPCTVFPRPTVKMMESRRRPPVCVSSRTAKGSTPPFETNSASWGESAASRPRASRMRTAWAGETQTTARDSPGRVSTWSTTASTAASTSTCGPSTMPDCGFGTPRPSTSTRLGLRPRLADGTSSRTSAYPCSRSVWVASSSCWARSVGSSHTGRMSAKAAIVESPPSARARRRLPMTTI